MSLRARLLLITLAMVAVALSAAGWATHQALRNFLVNRVDDQLAAARMPAARLAVDPGSPELGGPGGRIPPSALPAGSFVRTCATPPSSRCSRSSAPSAAPAATPR